ncbi:BCCT family transporter [Flammeovirga yaeyamensis]|uniref:BCCT family transporter n=1 Tax=Flammeovirga yaeyamensis TaxID=367791 RepID=A0AAX1N721_9BACT|nr:BCCT family transporter [Flammeovirga yaeyamensis]MBB3700620.1 glycine betaine transporter [Flammeovirga yaeyamensis]NMF37736.1 BCCT transporter [Flammeovirga yaeyamensis]QWG02045.1 BCCT family transporter [Flammeovirga yaeyamensis]
MKLNFNHYSIIISFCIASIFILFPETTVQALNYLINSVLQTCDRLLLWTVTSILIICIAIGLSPIGRLKLGEGKPEFSNFSWVSMLFAAGMGSGLIFWGVAEPVYHLQSPLNPDQDPYVALSITNFHWGLQAWGIYAFSGLIIAWFAYNKNRQMDISSSFGVKKGNKLFWALDLLAVITILFGVSGTLANSVAIVQTGLVRLTGIDSISGFSFRVILLILLSIAFMLSSVSGLKKGVKVLSDFNVLLTFVILGFIFYIISPLQALDVFFNSLISFVKELPRLSTSIPDEAREWSQTWTIVYFLWWVSWAPFCGLFIARISKGRTIREFIFSILFYPTLVTIFWFAVFGGGGLFSDYLPMFKEAINLDYTNGIYIFLEQLPLGEIVSYLCIFLLIVFVITSADSAIFVTSLLTKNGTTTNKIVWSIMLIFISIALLYENNVDLNKVISTTGAIPFMIILLLQGVMFFRSVKQDYKEKNK